MLRSLESTSSSWLSAYGLLRWATLLVVGLMLSAGASCSGPKREGPQVQDVPEGFIWDANASKARNIFPDERMVRQGAWTTMAIGDEDNSSIYITTYRGASDRYAIADAREDQVRRYGNHVDFGPLEELEIDGRDAYGWLETQHYKGELSSYQYKAVVPYDTLSYAVEYYSSHQRFMDPEAMRVLVTSFIVR